MLSRTQDNPVELGKRKLPFRRLDHFPGDTTEDGIDMSVGELLPDCIHILCRGHGGVLEFSSERKERSAIDYELLPVVCWTQMRVCSVRQ